MSNEFVPRKAEKHKVKLKMAVQGPSGSGKTFGALSLAKNMWPDAKICVIDTENESASLYADKFDFETIPLAPPFITIRYVNAIDAAVKSGADVLIIDTITAQWDGSGGILQRKNEMDMRGGNSFTNWSSFTPEHEAFKQVMLQAPIHVIATMRSKQDYILQANDKGKQMPKKVGMAPIQRDQIDYEFTIVFDVQMDHKAVCSKDRTGLFNDKVIDLALPETAAMIRGWLDNGVDTPKPQPAPTISDPPQDTAEDTGKFSLIGDGDKLECIVKGVAHRTSKKNTPYLCVTFNGKLEGFNYAFCYDTKFFDAILSAVDKQVIVRITPQKSTDKKKIAYFSIDDVMEVDGKPYDLGKLSGETYGEPITDPTPAA